MKRTNKKVLADLISKLKQYRRQDFKQFRSEIRELIQRIRLELKTFGKRLSRRNLKRMLGVSALFVALLFPSQASAQAAYAPSVANPFGLSSISGTIDNQNMVDLDGDGDMDIMEMRYTYNYSTYSYDSQFRYFLNTGTATNPAFAAAVTNPFGLSTFSGQLARPTFADMDNDGDEDMLVGFSDGYAGAYRYYQNTGTATAPAFSAGVNNPFGLGPTSFFAQCEFADMDGDGDYDILSSDFVFSYYAITPTMKYYQNTGTNLAPSFAAPLSNPFGFTFPYAVYFLSPSIKDLDGDGDLDILSGELTGKNFYYYQNTGTNVAPSFAASVQNPFGLTPTNPTNNYYGYNAPVLVDLDGDTDLDVLTVEYGGGFRYYQNMFINSGPLSIISIAQNAPSCSPGGDGSLQVFAGGGTPPIQYKIGVDSNSTGLFNNLAVGTYTLHIKDSLNATLDSIFTMAVDLPSIDSLGTTISNITCFGLNDGFVDIGVTGGTGPYTYNLSPMGASASSFYLNLAPGTYTASVTDSKNCTAANPLLITITQPPQLVLNIDSVLNVQCFANVNGAIYTTASGGVNPYTFTITPSIGTQLAPGEFTNLPPGFYTIQVDDNNFCFASVSQTINGPSSAVIFGTTTINNASSSTSFDGSISTSASGGTAPITYSITPNVGTQTPPGTFNGLNSQTYTITATDANGCTLTRTAFVGFTSAVKDYEQDGLSIYPNPAENELHIESSKSKIKSLEIVDLSGRSMVINMDQSGVLKLTNLPPALYMLRVELYNDKKYIIKIIKK